MVRFGRAAFAVVVVAALGAASPAGAAGAGTWRSLGMYPTPPANGGPAAPMPMVESKLEIVVRGALVEAQVTQVFVNGSDRATEATYIFPLPHDAAVTAMAIKLGDRTIEAAIERRGDAQRRYEAAVRAGVMAATTEQERADVFTQTVAAVPARGRVQITLRFDATASFADGTWALALPMVVAPRFVPGTASGRGTTGSGRSPDTDRAPDASRITPGASPGGGGATSARIAFADPVTDVTSPTHDLVRDTKAKDTYGFVDKLTDHDAVIRWRSTSPAMGWIEPTAEGGFAAVVVQAPAAPAKRGALRAMLVLDRAATMKGDATVTAQPFVRGLFAKLRNDDRVALHGGPATWTPPDTLKAIEAGWQKAGSPFDLTRTLQATRPDGAPIVLVTDGLVADDAAALAAAKKLGVPIHVIGVGPAPARGLLVRLAGITQGTVRFVSAADDLGLAATQLAADLAASPAPLAVNWGTLSVSDVVPAALPRLGAGQATLVVAKVRRTHAATPTANIRVRGELFAIETLAPPRPLDGAVTSAGPLARRWARLRLDDMLVGTENVAAVTAHALAYGLVSPYTTLVAIGTDVVVEGGVKHGVSVPVSVPAGMHWTQVKQETTPVAQTELDATLGKDSTRDGTTVAVADTTKPATKTSEKQPAKKPAGAKTVKAEPPAEPAAPVTSTTEASGAAPVADEEDELSPRKAGVREPEDGDEGGADSWAAPAADAPMLSREAVASSAYRRGVRIALLAGGGLSIQDAATAPLFALGLRLDVGRARDMLGVELALLGVRLDDGLDPQGRFLLAYTRRGVLLPFLELGTGLGAHVGAGTGPAWNLAVRLRLTHALGAFVRYDGARLVQPAGASQTQTTTTLGLEATF